MGQTLKPTANVIVVNHHPNWVLDSHRRGASFGESTTRGDGSDGEDGRNKGRAGRRKRAGIQKGLEYLMETVLKGKVK